MDDIDARALDAADRFDAAREERVFRCLRGVSTSDGPLFDRARDARMARDSDHEAAMRREEQDR